MAAAPKEPSADRSASEPADLHASEPPASGEKPTRDAPARSGRAARRHRILVAERDAEVRRWVSSALSRLGADIAEAEHGAELEHKLGHEGPFDLVVTHAQLAVQSGLSVLARARAKGDTTPFVVVTSIHGKSLQVFVSDAEGTVLSSRVVDGDNLAVLTSSLIERGHREG